MNMCDLFSDGNNPLWDEAQTMIEEIISVIGRETPPPLKRAEYMLLNFLEEHMETLNEYIMEELKVE